MDPIRVFARAEQRVRSITDRLAFAPALLARLSVGGAFAATGWGKLHNLPTVTEFFTELGIPAPGFHAMFVSSVELVGGSLLVIGLGSRLAAIPLIATMIVATATAKAADIAGFLDLFGTIEFCYAALLAWIAISGPGAASLDRLISRLLTRGNETDSKTTGALVETASAPAT
jgi:putative oxidoreductase